MNTRIILPAVLLGVSCLLPARAQNVFVDLGGTVGVTGTTTIDSPLGASTGTWGYSAVAPVVGTTWNILPRVATAALTSGQVGNPNSSSTPGDYNLLASPISLVDSLGGATTVTLNMISHYAGTSAGGSTTRESVQFNANAGAIPLTLMGNNWRDQNNAASGLSTTWEFVFTGLTANLTYDLYFYGSGNAANQGVTGTLGAANGGATATTTGIATTTSIFDAGQTTVVAQGTGWNELIGTADSSGNLSFIASRSTLSGQFFLNGMQLVGVPEPTTFALFGLGALGFAWRHRRPRR